MESDSGMQGREWRCGLDDGWVLGLLRDTVVDGIGDEHGDGWDGR